MPLDRRRFLELTALSSLAATGTSSASAQKIAPGNKQLPFVVEPGVRQLFLDNVGLQRTEFTRRVVNPPTRHPNNPLLSPDTPWERGCQVYGTAYFDQDENLFKLWYLTGPKDRGLKPLQLDGYERAPHTTMAAYAESHDGIYWEKPKLGIFPYDGDKQNNLLGIGKYNCEGISVLHEPHDPDPNRRWKAVYWDHGSGGWEVRNGGPYAKDGPEDGWYVAFSPDGIHWTPYQGNPVIKAYCDTNQNVVYDPRIKKYVGFSRFGLGRKLARSESSEFINWSKPELVLECDEDDGPNTQIYGAGVDLYEGVYLAMIWIYREGGDGKIDTQLATSRDGIHWTRVGDRETWLALGPDHSWEGGMARSVERIIIRHNQLYIYYCGVHGPHHGPNFKKVVRNSPVQIGLLLQRRDGFVSLDADNQQSNIFTQPFKMPDGDLQLNFDAPGGMVMVTVLKGKVDHQLAQSQLLTGDQPNLTVLKQTGNPATGLPQPGTEIRLKIASRKAKIYSYWFE